MKNDAAFAMAFGQANRAGFAAAEAIKPRAMVVVGGVPGEAPEAYYVSEGMCGFAWVNVSPGNSPFANWLKKNGHARKSYYGGVDIWISAHGQSVERKEAHANKMAAVLKEALGVNAHAMSRLD
jgi:hypothetical protein